LVAPDAPAVVGHTRRDTDWRIPGGLPTGQETCIGLTAVPAAERGAMRVARDAFSLLSGVAIDRHPHVAAARLNQQQATLRGGRLGSDRATGLIDRIACEPDVDLALDVSPFRRLPQASHQLLEGVRVLRGELEPGQEVKRLAQVAAMV
jgi:hypothetical protein